MSFGLTVPGRLGADPEIRHTAKGTTVANFRVAVSGYDREEKEETTTWVRVVMWGARGEQVAKLLSKGDAVCFMGTGELKSYAGKNGEVWYLECTASDCALMGKSQVKEDERDHREAEKKPAQRSRPKDDDDETIPF